MRSHLLEGNGPASAAPARSSTTSSTTSTTSRSTSTSSTRSTAPLAPGRAQPPEPLRVPRRRPLRAGAGDDIDGVHPRSPARAKAIDPTGWRITLVTNLRVLGYVFNPASFYLCRDADGVLRVVIVEVHNTHGERHLYTLQPDGGGRSVRGLDGQGRSTSRRSSRCEGGYTVRVRDEPAGLRITINRATQARRARAAAPASSCDGGRSRTAPWPRMLVRHPLVTHKTIGLIHWHALRLWLRGARSIATGTRPMTAPTIARTATVGSEPLLEPAAWRDRPGRRLADPRRSPDRRPARRLAARRSAIPARRSRARSTSTTRPLVAALLLLGGDIGAGEAYMDGLWSSPDLPALLRLAALNRSARPSRPAGGACPSQLARTLAHRARRNTTARRAATSPPTTTSATTSTGSSSTRR